MLRGEEMDKLVKTAFEAASWGRLSLHLHLARLRVKTGVSLNLRECHELYVCVSPKLICWNPNPQHDGSRRRDL